MRRSLIFAALCAALIVAGCDSSAPPPSRGVHPATTLVPRPADIPQSAARPEGYTPAAPPTGLTLTGLNIHVSSSGLHFIEGFEGFSSCPYLDTVGTGNPYTRGFGETEGISRFSACISRAQGEANLRYRLERFYGWAVRGLGVSLNQNQADALYSFAWNLGAGIFTGSLRRAIQRHDPYPLLGYDHAGGVVLSGLARRRRAEVALFLKPAHEETPAQHRARVHRERVAQLHADYRKRSALRSVIAHHRCSHGYAHLKRDTRRKCTIWRSRGAQVNGDIKRLHRLGIR